MRIGAFCSVKLPLTIEILHIVSRFDLFKTINRYLLQLVSFSISKYIYFDAISSSFCTMHVSYALLTVTHSKDWLLPGNQNTRNRF